jgi:hypothetical protein
MALASVSIASFTTARLNKKVPAGPSFSAAKPHIEIITARSMAFIGDETPFCAPAFL